MKRPLFVEIVDTEKWNMDLMLQLWAVLVLKWWQNFLMDEIWHVISDRWKVMDNFLKSYFDMDSVEVCYYI